MADPLILNPLIEYGVFRHKPSWQDISAYSPTTKQYIGPLEFSTSQEWCSIPKIRIRGWKDIQVAISTSSISYPRGTQKNCMAAQQEVISASEGPKIRSRGKLHRYNVGAPFERIAFDILGPLPRTASGNKYLLVVIDYFTKWPEVYPIPDQEAPTVAEAVVQHWISRYGVPLQLHSDQGKKFRLCPAVLKGSVNYSGIDKTKTTPLHPQCFLAEIFVSRDLLFGRPPDTPSSPEEYVQNLQARFEDVHNLARERINLRTEDEDSVRHKATGHQFKEGDKVWFYNPTRRKGLSPKLQSHWDGPYTILKIINDVVIRIRKSTNSKPRVVHYDRLAPYYGYNS
ncbi:retrovirus-related Pol polyprotein from transposon 412 [Trichonephila clavipes]|nr:retrovirus-related Pol polyprotein from transposon 412 [Trichonephila clavipes]